MLILFFQWAVGLGRETKAGLLLECFVLQNWVLTTFACVCIHVCLLDFEPLAMKSMVMKFDGNTACLRWPQTELLASGHGFSARFYLMVQSAYAGPLNSRTLAEQSDLRIRAYTSS